MNFFKKLMPMMLGLLVMAGSVYAQSTKAAAKDVTDQELKEFVTTANAVQQIQREAQMQMQKMINEEGIKPQRFQMIMISKRNPKMADSVNVTQEEEQAYENIKPKMEKVNQQALQKFQGAIKDNGLTRQRFQEIAKAMQGDQDLQKRFQKMKMKEMKMNSDSSNSGNS